MSDLSLQTSRILTALHCLYAVVDVADFPQHLMGVLSELLPASAISLDQIDWQTAEVRNLHEAGFTVEETQLLQQLQTHFIRAMENARLFTALRGTPHTDFRFWRNHGLTRRECEVLRWLMEGKRNSEIAIILDAQPRTIGKHIENIFAKLRVETRTAAAAQAHDLLHPASAQPTPAHPPPTVNDVFPKTPPSP